MKIRLSQTQNFLRIHHRRVEQFHCNEWIFPQFIHSFVWTQSFGGSIPSFFLSSSNKTSNHVTAQRFQLARHVNFGWVGEWRARRSFVWCGWLAIGRFVGCDCGGFMAESEGDGGCGYFLQKFRLYETRSVSWRFITRPSPACDSGWQEERMRVPDFVWRFYVLDRVLFVQFMTLVGYADPWIF